MAHEKTQTRRSRKRRSHEEWQELVWVWRESGISRVAFAAEHDLAQTTFSHWVRRLPGRRPTGFVQVVAAPLEEPAPHSTVAMSLQLGNSMRLEWHALASAEYITELVAGLGRC